jgi:hypothetical protein
MFGQSKFYIRFNPVSQALLCPKVWRIVENEEENFASEIKLFVPAHTESRQENGETQWNIVCSGVLTWDGSCAIISASK